MYVCLNTPLPKAPKRGMRALHTDGHVEINIFEHHWRPQPAKTALRRGSTELQHHPCGKGSPSQGRTLRATNEHRCIIPQGSQNPRPPQQKSNTNQTTTNKPKKQQRTTKSKRQNGTQSPQAIHRAMWNHALRACTKEKLDRHAGPSS